MLDFDWTTTEKNADLSRPMNEARKLEQAVGSVYRDCDILFEDLFEYMSAYMTAQ